MGPLNAVHTSIGRALGTGCNTPRQCPVRHCHFTPTDSGGHAEARTCRTDRHEQARTGTDRHAQAAQAAQAARNRQRPGSKMMRISVLRRHRGVVAARLLCARSSDPVAGSLTFDTVRELAFELRRAWLSHVIPTHGPAAILVPGSRHFGSSWSSSFSLFVVGRRVGRTSRRRREKNGVNRRREDGRRRASGGGGGRGVAGVSLHGA
eukprot:6392449-Prymnesium_polylepis.1